LAASQVRAFPCCLCVSWSYAHFPTYFLAALLLLQERVPGATRVVDMVCTEGSTVVAVVQVRAVLCNTQPLRAACVCRWCICPRPPLAVLVLLVRQGRRRGVHGGGGAGTGLFPCSTHLLCPCCVCLCVHLTCVVRALNASGTRCRRCVEGVRGGGVAGTCSSLVRIRGVTSTFSLTLFVCLWLVCVRNGVAGRDPRGGTWDQHTRRAGVSAADGVRGDVGGLRAVDPAGRGVVGAVNGGPDGGGGAGAWCASRPVRVHGVHSHLPCYPIHS